MKKTGKNIKKNKKEKKEIPKNNNKNKVTQAISKFPQDTVVPNENNENNISVIEENGNVIANILQTNKIKNEPYRDQEVLENISQIKYTKRDSNSSIYIEDDYKETGDFNFISISEKVKPFLYKPQKSKEYSSHAFNNFNFLDIANTYRMIINILVDDDSLHSSNNLSKIFELIVLSLKDLNEINITNKDFLVCIYFQHFSNDKTFKEVFPGLNFFNCNNWNLKMNTFYCSYGEVISVNDTPIYVLNFYKESATYVEVYKFFYCNVINDLITLINADAKEIGKTFLVVNWPNGKLYKQSINKHFKSTILPNIFRICNNRNMVLIPDINYHINLKKDFFGYINKYNLDSDKIYVNLLWDSMCAYPIDHRFFFINMNFKLYLVLNEYYQNNKINIYANPYYHDYNLSLYLKQQVKNIVIQKIQQIKIEYDDIPSSLIDFFYDYTLRKGSEYANFIPLFFYFISFKNMSCVKFLQKFVVLFKLGCFLVEYFWLGLSLLISYVVFNDTFGSGDNNMDYFCSLGYAMIVILLLFISTIYIKNKTKIKLNRIYRNVKRNQESYVILFILYAVHYIYNAFFLICSIFALIHVEQGKSKEKGNKDYYLFQKKFFILLIIFNFLFIILPSFIRTGNLVSKGILYYIIAQLPNSTCFFHVPYLFTSIRNVNSNNRYLESVYISLYLLLNGLLTVMCIVFDTKRQRRMDFLYVIATIYAVLNGIKLVIIVIGFCLQNKFNKNIIYGQIPQYNVVNSEYENNLNDVNLYDNNTLNNRNDKNDRNEGNDNLKMNKNENNNSFGQNIYDKNVVYESKNVLSNNNMEKEHSSELDINSFDKNNLDLEKSLERNNYIERSNKSNKNIIKEDPIFKFDDLNSVKKTLTEDFKMKDLNYNLSKEKNLYENNINENDSNFYINNTNTNMDINTNIDMNNNNNENIINTAMNNDINNANNGNNEDVEGIIYPFDSEEGMPNVNDENENNINENNNNEINNEYYGNNNIDYNNYQGNIYYNEDMDNSGQ